MIHKTKRYLRRGVTLPLLLLLFSSYSYGQDPVSGVSTITANELKSHTSFLASAELAGRSTGEPGMEIATRYLEAQTMRPGLRPANGNSYLQPYTLLRSVIDHEKSGIFITENGDQKVVDKPIYQIVPFGSNKVDLDGDVAFAGYGISSQIYNYYDFSGIDVTGKIILIMNRAPMNEDGLECQFEEGGWTSTMNFNLKYMNLMYKKPKAILIVMDLKSGHKSHDDSSPGTGGNHSQTNN
ncbi:MAG TPA: hypothetical protein VMW76_03175 [Bacteroidales bacterium]|nr:hypothetical protein [Bacteroidales bacterium]